MRPHVLWFDECYDEQKYRYQSAVNATINADLLLTIGSSGATNLPMMMANIAMDRNIPIIDINVEANPFSEFAATFNGDIRATASEALPLLVETMIAALDEPDD
jgi:NAD-dependent deacetylase